MQATPSFFLHLDQRGYSAEPREPRLAESGEHALMRAVLHDGIDMLLRHRHATSRRHKRLFLETHTWVWSDEDHHLYSFISLCEALQLDYGYIRRGLARAIQAPPNEEKPIRYKQRMHHLAYTKFRVGSVDTLGTRKKKAA